MNIYFRYLICVRRRNLRSICISQALLPATPLQSPSTQTCSIRGLLGLSVLSTPVKERRPLSSARAIQIPACGLLSEMKTWDLIIMCVSSLFKRALSRFLLENSKKRNFTRKLRALNFSQEAEGRSIVPHLISYFGVGLMRKFITKNEWLSNLYVYKLIVLIYTARLLLLTVRRLLLLFKIIIK